MKLKAFWKKYRAYLAVSAVLVAGACCLLFYARPEEVQPDIVVTGSINDTESEEMKADAPGITPLSDEDPVAVEQASGEEAEVEAPEERNDLREQKASEVEENKGGVSETAPEPTKASEAVPESTSVSTPVPTPAPTPVSESTPLPEPEDTLTPVPEDAATPVPVDTPSPAPEVKQEPCTHNWIFTSYYQEPTCGNGGLESQVCAVCGETRTTSGTPTGKHSFVVETPGDCCTEELVRCEDCNHREVRAKDAGNHMDVEDGFCYGCGQEVKDAE